MPGRDEPADARMIIVLLQQRQLRLVNVFLGLERPGTETACTGHRIEDLLEQPMARVLRIGQDTRPRGASSVEDHPSVGIHVERDVPVICAQEEEVVVSKAGIVVLADTETHADQVEA